MAIAPERELILQVVRDLARQRVARLFELPPAVIIRDGAIDRREMRRQFLTPGELESAMREHDIEDLSNVRLGTLEPNGSISFVKRSSGGG